MQSDFDAGKDAAGLHAPPPRDGIAAAFLVDEVELVAKLAGSAKATPDEHRRIAELAARLVRPPAPAATSTAASMPSCTSTGSPRRKASS